MLAQVTQIADSAQVSGELLFRFNFNQFTMTFMYLKVELLRDCFLYEIAVIELIYGPLNAASVVIYADCMQQI